MKDVTQKTASQATTSQAAPTQYKEVVGERGRIGKSLFANRLRDHLEVNGSFVRVVRVESRNGAPPAREDDIRIYVDANDEELVGGDAALFDPVWNALMQMKASGGGTLIVDFMAGAERLRAKFHASVSLDEMLTRHNIEGESFCITTRDASVMNQALNSLRATHLISPSFRRVLVKNALSGPFRFAGVAEGATLEEQLRAEEGIIELTFPLIQAKAWQALEAAHLEMRAVLEMPASLLSAKCGCSELVAQACQNWMAAWWTATEKELGRVLPFPAPTA